MIKDTNIQHPRKHCLAEHKTIMEMVAALRENGATVEHEKSAGIIKAWVDNIVIYQAMQKGSGTANWIVSYRTDYFE